MSFSAELVEERKRNNIEGEDAIEELVLNHPLFIEVDTELKKTKEELTLTLINSGSLNEEYILNQNEYL